MFDCGFAGAWNNGRTADRSASCAPTPAVAQRRALTLHHAADLEPAQWIGSTLATLDETLRAAGARRSGYGARSVS